MPDIFEFLSLSEAQEDPIDEFLSTVANHQMLSLVEVRQTGIHHGQTMYAHLLNVVLTVDLAAQIIGCTAFERRILICAALLHDLNKLDPEQRSISKVANTSDVAAFLRQFGLDQILEITDENVEIIRRLIAAHSGHLHQGADALLPLAGPISRQRLRTVLVPLLQLADQADVAREFGDDRKRMQVLNSLNAASDQQYRWEWHRLNEYRGPFSNLLHNAVGEELQAQCQARPFLHYGEGTFYLVPANAPSTLANDTLARISKRLADKVKRLKGGNAKDFVTGSPVGIKINPELFATALTIKDAFEAASSVILGRAFKGEAIADMEQKAQRRAKEGFETLLDGNGHLFSRDPDVMRKGEALRVAYNFLQAHCSVLFKGKNKVYDDAWQPIYTACELTVNPEWMLFDALNDRAYVIARTVSDELHQLLDRLTEMAASFEEKLGLRGSEGGQSGSSVFAEYVENVLNLSSLTPTRTQFQKHLDLYSNPKLEVCSLCGLPLPAQVMMAGDVPKGLVVAQFSNRNLAGTGDPKRNSCPICREQLLVEKIGFAPAMSKGFYLHIYPESFAPPLFVEALRKTFRQLQGADVKAVLFDTRAITREFEQTHTLKLPFKPKATGLVIPMYSELVGNIITLPIYALGDNDTDRYLFALQYALYIQQRFGQRVVLTQSLVPPVTVAEMMETEGDNGIKLYCDDLPGALLGLIPQNTLTGAASDEVFHLLFLLKLVADKVGTGEDLTDLVRSLMDGELGPFFAAHRAIERNSKNEGAANNTGGQVAERLKEVSQIVFQRTQGENPMSEVSLAAILEQMAELAWKKSIRRGSLAHTALIKPMDIVFQLLRRQASQEIAFLRLVAAEDVLRHIERTSDYAMSAERAAAIESWANLFFDELLAKGFHGDIRRLIRDEKLVKAAYTTLMRNQLRKASEAKKQAAADSKS